MTTATTGTGTITLVSAVSGYLTFALAGAADGEVVAYAINDGVNSEHGTGTLGSTATTLTRTVTNSTNSNAAISLSGSAQVFISPRAADIGKWSNRRVAKTAAYAVLNADAGATIALAGAAYYALTFNAPSGYDTDFVVAVLNEDTGRGKTISISGGTSFILSPGQTVQIYNQNNVWIVQGQGRWRLPGATPGANTYTFRVNNALGSNSAADGMATGAGAWQTKQFAMDWLAANIDMNGQYLKLILEDLSTTPQTTLILKTMVGLYDDWPNSPLLLEGNLSTPVAWSSGVNIPIQAVGVQGWRIQGFSFTAAAAAEFVNADIGSKIFMGANTYNGTVTTAFFGSIYGGTVELVGTQISNVTAAAFYSYSVFGGTTIFIGNTLTFNANIVFTAFYNADAQSKIIAAGNTSNGTGAAGSTGLTFLTTNGSYVNTGGHPAGTGGGANPVGSVAGTATTGYVV